MEVKEHLSSGCLGRHPGRLAGRFRRCSLIRIRRFPVALCSGRLSLAPPLNYTPPRNPVSNKQAAGAPGMFCPRRADTRWGDDPG